MKTVSRRYIRTALFLFAIAALTVSLPLPPVPASAAGLTQFDDVSSLAADCDPCTFPHTVTTGGSDRIIVVAVAWEPKAGVSLVGVTYAGDALTEIRIDISGNKSASSLYYKVDPQTGPNTVSIDFSGSAKGSFGALSFTGVDQATPIDAHNGASGAGTTQTVDVTTVTDNAWVVDAVFHARVAPVVGANQTERFNACVGARPCGAGSTEETTTAGTYTMSWTTTDNKDWAISAAALRPATASVTITESAASTDVTEGGATDTYDVVLDAAPTGNVTVTLTPDAQVTVSPTPLTFTTADWSTAQTVTVTAVDDAIVEGSHTGTITHSAAGGDYDGVSISNVVANVTDDDATVTLTESGGSTDVEEGGPTDTYDVVLDAAPTATVTITITPDAQVTTSASTLTFTTGDWSTAQTVTVTAVDDAAVEGGHTGTITHSASGGDYDSASISNVVANITDNDAPPGVTITESAGSTDVVEGGATDTYDVVLDAAPSGTVTITITPDSQVTASPAPLTFTTGDWSTAQTVTVTAVDDAVVEGAHTGTITHSASGGGYDAVPISNVVANVTDDDATVTLTESGGSTNITEGGPTDTYDVVLDAAPTATVTITITPDAQVTASAPTLTFTTGDWSTAQTVTVTAVNDAMVEGAHTGTITHSASGGGYDGASIPNVVANITDNDTPSVTITESGGSTDVTEGGPTDTYDVVLDLEPSGTVTITVSPDAQVSVSAATLTFTTADWSAAQTITVTAVDDSTFEGAHTGTITHSASGGSYDSASISNVVANITDDDPAPPQVLEQLQFRWYQNLDAVPPTTPLAAENTFVAGSVVSTVYHLRINVSVTGANLNPGANFKLQFATVIAGPWTDVGGLGSGLAWRGFDNSTPADGVTLGSVVLSLSTAAERQTYEEANISAATPNRINKNRVGEWAWVVQNNAGAPGTTYYFRMVWSDSSQLNTYTTYPEIATPGVTITPNNTDSGSPDAVVSHTHTVTNTGRGADTFDITTASTEGWTVALYESDGITPLVDTDADTVPDTGNMAASASVNVVVKVTVGWSATSDVTTVTATSSVDTTVQDDATDTTNAPPTITLTLSDLSMALGTPDPDCEGNPDATVVGEFTVYNGTAGNEGCAYAWSPVTVTVESNMPWTGTVTGSDGSPTSGVTVATGSFRYDTAGAATSYLECDSDTALTTTATDFESAGTQGNNQVYTQHHCVILDWDDGDGTIDSTITYTASQ